MSDWATLYQKFSIFNKEGVIYKETRIRLALDLPQKTKAKNDLRENNIEFYTPIKLLI